MKKCHWCEKKSEYSCSFSSQDNIFTDIQACDEHKLLAFCKQDDLVRQDKLKQTIKLWKE